ncbi:MAG TPA: sigma-70 family RNA polymerase sigma factor [Planctomycetes bacterium]|nr:sigma-70 family RNA polymerase sigma factor [Planctomycetota bacterium]
MNDPSRPPRDDDDLTDSRCRQVGRAHGEVGESVQVHVAQAGHREAEVSPGHTRQRVQKAPVRAGTDLDPVTSPKGEIRPSVPIEVARTRQGRPQTGARHCPRHAMRHVLSAQIAADGESEKEYEGASRHARAWRQRGGVSRTGTTSASPCPSKKLPAILDEDRQDGMDAHDADNEPRVRGASPPRKAPAEEDWKALYPLLWKQAFGFLADAAEAEDLAQETIMKLMHAKKKGHPIARPKAWCRRVLANLCRDHLRREKRRFAAHEALEQKARSPKRPGPLSTLEQSELRGRLAESLSRLSPREREVFVLKDLEELPTTEVAEALELQPSSVRALLSQARKRLRTLLGSQEEAPRP